jgi:uncharacterized protein YrzB (UPF0473 family)
LYYTGYNIIIKIKGGINMDDEIIELTDESGNKIKYEILDVIYKDEDEYAVMLPEDSEDEVVIFKIVPLAKEDEVEYHEVEDDDLADEIFNEFVKRTEE